MTRDIIREELPYMERAELEARLAQLRAEMEEAIMADWENPEPMYPARCRACGWTGEAAASDCPECGAVALTAR